MVAESKKAKEEMLHHHSDYDDAVHHCCFGTALVPEGLWSFADCVMTKRRSSTSPLTFESILYLNFNSELWDLNDVIEANNRRKNETNANQARLRETRDRINNMRERMNDWNAFQTLLAEIDSNIVHVVESDDSDEE